MTNSPGPRHTELTPSPPHCPNNFRISLMVDIDNTPISKNSLILNDVLPTLAKTNYTKLE
jgi:hypothetical protein